MTYLGKIKNGLVVLEGQPDLPEGTVVRVESVEPHPLMDLVQVTQGFMPDTTWPADGASQIEHYLYGTPKQ